MREPRGLARLWAEVLRYVVQLLSPGYGSWDQFADDMGIPEETWGRLAQERARLEGLGATFGREVTWMAGEIWIEMYDPEGNWFCVQ